MQHDIIQIGRGKVGTKVYFDKDCVKGANYVSQYLP